VGVNMESCVREVQRCRPSGGSPQHSEDECISELFHQKPVHTQQSFDCTMRRTSFSPFD
jgi:hypothetical protein